MFKIGQRYTYAGNKCTVHLVHKDKNVALVRYDNSLLGHNGFINDLDYYCNDNGEKVTFIAGNSNGYYFINKSDNLKLIGEQITDYEIY